MSQVGVAANAIGTPAMLLRITPAFKGCSGHIECLVRRSDDSDCLPLWKAKSMADELCVTKHCGAIVRISISTA
ncbi:hypothetical protein B5V02_10890 [Mesorhizobium kowhaii]|uniref:Uncharacterized protein n=1 Tax=Mesorhizobium kowhaii TaxID=1300272 RepID=A0A2W7C735_9HYPH|nr:hypothetical protein B5V02_10890 [Mesorhizobium kowhaii]